MHKRCLILLMTFIVSLSAFSQIDPFKYWTLLPPAVMDEIIGEASGETAYNTILETGAYNKDRLASNYDGLFYESAYILKQLKLYGLSGARIDDYPGGDVWDGIKGSLWEISPKRRKLASYMDMTAMLAKGSTNADVKAELVWIGQGRKQDFDPADVDGKIVVTEGSLSNSHTNACQNASALGVIAISGSRPHFDPTQIPWRGLGGWRSSSDNMKFGFYLTAREGEFLKKRLIRGEKIKVHAQVKAKKEKYRLQNVTCHIPGTDPDAGEIIFSAHLFEGITKQGANDNKSGSAGILEVARLLNTLINEGRIDPPKRTIRFLWGPEFSGTGPWVQDHMELMDKTLCNINMDMVGEWLSKNQSYMCLIRTTLGNAHYINDVMENYYRYIGEVTRERIYGASGVSRVGRRIMAPSGSDEPFAYSIEVHSGSSDHEIFNDWGVAVPGVMMIAWPDQWYHTSGDRPDKADPTQMKRIAIIGAASAYNIACADDAMVMRIAGETASNGTRRLGHAWILAQNYLNDSDGTCIDENYRNAIGKLQTAEEFELAVLESVMELANNKNELNTYIEKLKASIRTTTASHKAALNLQMSIKSRQLGVEAQKHQQSKLERDASLMIPVRTAKVREMGYRGWRGYSDEIPEDAKEKYPYNRREIARTSELQCLINGDRSVLDIKRCLDGQYQRESSLKAVMNYIYQLEAARFVTFK
ncbi:M28 family peptidase [bacterium]|nr:M28 family peptidase [bacterium]